MKQYILALIFAIISVYSDAQAKKSIFANYFMEEVPENKFGEILISKTGYVLVSCTDFSFAQISGSVFTPYGIGLSKSYIIKNIKNSFDGDPMKNIVESSDHNIFFTNANNQISFFKNTETGYCDLPPFYFPMKGETKKTISALWLDNKDNLYIGTRDDAFYIVANAGSDHSLDSNRYKTGSTADSAFVIYKGELAVKRVTIQKANGIFCFAQNGFAKNIIWIGTGNGLYSYNLRSEQLNEVLRPEGKITITDMEVLANGDIWFSTLERGMGLYRTVEGAVRYHPYPRSKSDISSLFPIQNFFIKSPSEFFVAVRDSFPAIFNIDRGTYRFMADPLKSPHFTQTKNITTDIKMDSSGKVLFIKGDILYSSSIDAVPEWVGDTKLTIIATPLIYQITDLNRRVIADYSTRPAKLKELTLSHSENSVIVYFTSNSFKEDQRTEFAWKLEGSDINYWYQLPPVSNSNDSSHVAELPNLKPGKYLLKVKMRLAGEGWDPQEAKLVITVSRPYWSNLWFWALVIGTLGLLGYMFAKARINTVRKTEKLRSAYEKELMELEAKALRSQMNPHFIFNCLNSIKALMQDKENEKGVTYLTTFSKLIRTLFNNADKKEITLYDEIETCKYYLQLESMRFGSKFTYHVDISPDIDLKSVYIPALILQPFIENAIWHGIMPKATPGRVNVTVKKDKSEIYIMIDDDGIGRVASGEIKRGIAATHHSKGINLTKSRLELDNLLRQRKASINTIDKIDAKESSSGTTVILKLPIED